MPARPVADGVRRTSLLAAACLVVASLGVVTGPGATARDELAERQRHVEHRIERAHDRLEHSSAQARRAAARAVRTQDRLIAARSRLGRVRERLENARRYDRRAERRFGRARARLELARAELAEGRREVAEQRAAVARLVAAIYTAGDPELLAFSAVLQAQSAADLTRRLEARNVVVGSETRTYEDLRLAEIRLAQTATRVQRATAIVATWRERAAANLRTVKTLTAQARGAARRFKAALADRRTARGAAARARRADQAALRRLREDAARIREMLRRRAAAARARHGGGAPGNSGGFLDHPVNGYVTSPYGYRRHPIYGYWGLHDGVDFGSGCGAPLYAAANGRVVSRYYQSSYGNRLIIDHGYARGAGVATIYNHAIRYTVGAGQRVSRGQVVGFMGSTGWSTGCHLHFTVMVNGRPVDPMRWL